eukprot:TRINITY_DN7438_c0_g1_i4.p1 TRINITY_DN7438_c0_g1~~TRINITY_DN7438_c0_g1_i4.p1  ORF type:complete len:396 (+),score=19.18 TRINITY_DN7438_c0_g1_i4:147-1334(+)
MQHSCVELSRSPRLQSEEESVCQLAQEVEPQISPRLVATDVLRASSPPRPSLARPSTFVQPAGNLTFARQGSIFARQVTQINSDISGDTRSYAPSSTITARVSLTGITYPKTSAAGAVFRPTAVAAAVWVTTFLVLMFDNCMAAGHCWSAEAVLYRVMSLLPPAHSFAWTCGKLAGGVAGGYHSSWVFLVIASIGRMLYDDLAFPVCLFIWIVLFIGKSKRRTLFVAFGVWIVVFQWGLVLCMENFDVLADNMGHTHHAAYQFSVPIICIIYERGGYYSLVWLWRKWHDDAPPLLLSLGLALLVASKETLRLFTYLSFTGIRGNLDMGWMTDIDILWKACGSLIPQVILEVGSRMMVVKTLLSACRGRKALVKPESDLMRQIKFTYVCNGCIRTC